MFSIESIIIVISLLFSAFFSSMELAFVSANRLHIALQKEKGRVNGTILSAFIEKPSLFITTMLTGNTAAMVIYGIYMAKILDIPIANLLRQYVFINIPAPDVAVLTVQSLVSTLLVLAVAEFLPKSLALINPDKLLDFFALPLQLVYKFFFPFVFIIEKLSKFFIIKVLKMPYKEPKPVFGLTDLGQYVSNISTEDENSTEVDTKLFSNALEFKSATIRDCMIPRTEMTAMDKREGIERLQQIFTESGHSKIPIFDESIDNMVGYCHCLELFKKPTNLQDIITDLSIVPQTMPANELLLQFISEHKSIALVVDEFGGTAGLVTIEDVMEEIVGEIDDEHDTPIPEVKQIDEKTFEVNARSEVDLLNENYDWQIPEGDYETLSGYLIALTETIPEVGTKIETDQLTITIIEKSDTRVEQVQVQTKATNE